MPIFEYVCGGCGNRFEALVYGGKAPDCPSCGGSDLEKQFSSFAVGGSGSTGGAPDGCPMPSGGG